MSPHVNGVDGTERVVVGQRRNDDVLPVYLVRIEWIAYQDLSAAGSWPAGVCGGRSGFEPVPWSNVEGVPGKTTDSFYCFVGLQPLSQSQLVFELLVQEVV